MIFYKIQSERLRALTVKGV